MPPVLCLRCGSKCEAGWSGIGMARWNWVEWRRSSRLAQPLDKIMTSLTRKH